MENRSLTISIVILQVKLLWDSINLGLSIIDPNDSLYPIFGLIFQKLTNDGSSIFLFSSLLLSLFSSYLVFLAYFGKKELSNHLEFKKLKRITNIWISYFLAGIFSTLTFYLFITNPERNFQLFNLLNLLLWLTFLVLFLVELITTLGIQNNDQNKRFKNLNLAHIALIILPIFASYILYSLYVDQNTLTTEGNGQDYFNVINQTNLVFGILNSLVFLGISYAMRQMCLSLKMDKEHLIYPEYHG